MAELPDSNSEVDPGAASAERYDLAARFVVGQRWTFETLRRVSTRAEAREGERVLEARTREEELSVAGSAEALKVDSGRPIALRASYGPACCVRIQRDAGEFEVRPLPVAGLTVRAERGEDGRLTHDYEGEDPAVLAQIAWLLDARKDLLRPLGPVRLGATWEAGTEAIHGLFELGPADRGGVRCRLADVRAIAGRRVAELAIATRVERPAGEASSAMRIDLATTAHIDLATGQFLLMDTRGLATTAPGAARIWLSAHIEIHSLARWVISSPK